MKTYYYVADINNYNQTSYLDEEEDPGYEFGTFLEMYIQSDDAVGICDEVSFNLSTTSCENCLILTVSSPNEDFFEYINKLSEVTLTKVCEVDGQLITSNTYSG